MGREGELELPAVSFPHRHVSQATIGCSSAGGRVGGELAGGGGDKKDGIPLVSLSGPSL